MSQIFSLNAAIRDRAGKGASRALRRAGRVPAVIYGAGQEPVVVSLNGIDLFKLLRTGHFLNAMVDLSVDGTVERTLPRDVAFHPVTDQPIHVDFLRVGADTMVTVMAPVRFIDQDKSPGLKRGGVLNIVRHEVELLCPASNIPDDLVVSVAGADIGASIHISQVTLPEGVKPTITDRDFTLATLMQPSGLRSKEEGAEA